MIKTFTIEKEVNGKLPFLDVSVRREDGGLLRTSVYREPTDTDQLLKFDSHHPTSVKSAVVHSLVNRLGTHFMEDDFEGKEAEKDYINDVLSANGYPDGFVRHVMQSKGRKSGVEDKREQDEQVIDRWVGLPYVSVNQLPTYFVLCT